MVVISRILSCGKRVHRGKRKGRPLGHRLRKADQSAFPGIGMQKKRTFPRAEKPGGILKIG
jgi:hypothetical protein